MRSIFVDSSAFLALLDRDERLHARVRQAFEESVATFSHHLTTNFVFDETYTLILSRLGRRRAIEWGESVIASRVLEMIRVDEDHETQAWRILLAFEDKDFSYTDATSFAVSADLGVEDVLSVDRHFHQYGTFRVLPSD